MATQVTLGSGVVSSAGSLKLQTNGTTDAVTVDTSQNVGLGVTPSAWQSGWKALQVGASTALSDSGGGNTDLTSNYYRNSGDFYLANGYATLYRQASGQHRWFTAPNNVSGAGAAITFTQAMTLDASGNLLVGRTSGSERLSVQNLSATSTTVGANVIAGFRSNAANADTCITLTDGVGSSAHFGQIQGSLYWMTNNTERARIDSSGNLLVGTTTTSLISTNTAGSVIKAAGGIQFMQTANTSDWGIKATSGSICNFYSWNGSAAVLAGSISVNGNVTTYGSVSDYRLKDFVAPVSGAGERIDALNPVEFEWKSNGQRTRGFFAHEFQQVYTSSVTGEKDSVDEDGNPVYQYMQAGNSEVIADLVSEIKSLRARVKQLEGN